MTWYMLLICAGWIWGWICVIEIKTKQIKPLGSGAPIWENDTSDYPDVIKVPMADGHVITYRRDMSQQDPRLLRSIELIRIMKKHTYGGRKEETR